MFFDKLKEEKIDIRSLAETKIAVIGQGTGKALEDRGFYADLMPEIYDGKTLGAALAKECTGTEKILIPRARMGSQELLAELKTVKGVQIQDVATYDTVYETQELIDEQKEFKQGNIDYAVFTSASTVRGFSQAVKNIDYTKVKAVCIGKQTAAAAAELGMQTAVARMATMDSVVECLEELCSTERV